MERAELKSLLDRTGCARQCGGFVFLEDPQWNPSERAAVAEAQAVAANSVADTQAGWVCIRTGGTGGEIRFARHDERTLSAAVDGWCAHFGVSGANTVDVLPPHHVSGLMARVRCAATGGRHMPWDWKRLESGDHPDLAAAGGSWVISLVPTQLQRMLRNDRGADWLRRFEMIFVGGGPSWSALLDAAAAARLRLSPCYGMTETAAMIAAVKPDEFLAGARSCGTALPHATIRITANGVIAVAGESICHGYIQRNVGAVAPDDLHALREHAAGGAGREFVTEDLGRIDERGHLHVSGRRDGVIITGGRKVHLAGVEAVLRSSGEFEDVAVLGVPDPEWGEAIVACFPQSGRAPDLARASAALPAHQRPKRYARIHPWPRNAQGKINRSTLRELLARGE